MKNQIVSLREFEHCGAKFTSLKQMVHEDPGILRFIISEKWGSFLFKIEHKVRKETKDNVDEETIWVTSI